MSLSSPRPELASLPLARPSGAETPAFSVLDGGISTLLARAGVDLHHPLWTARALLERPDALVAVHTAYAEAGAEFLCTASYQLSFEGLAQIGMDDAAAAELFARSARCVREALAGSGREAIVVGSLGSWGACAADGSEYRGDYARARAELLDFHRARVDALAPHVDMLAFETIPNRLEVEVLCELLCETDAPPAWISMPLAPGGEGSPRMADGTPLSQLAESLAGWSGLRRRLAGLGVNCCPPRRVAAALHALNEGWTTAETRPAWVAYPNAGERWADGEWRGEATTPSDFAAYAQEWLAAGAALIGSCCRTDDEHTRALADLAHRENGHMQR